MCDQCLIAEVHPEWVEPLVQMIRLDGMLFSPTVEAVELAVLFFRFTRSPYHVPPRVRRTISEDMITRRNN